MKLAIWSVRVHECISGCGVWMNRGFCHTTPQFTGEWSGMLLLDKKLWHGSFYHFTVFFMPRRQYRHLTRLSAVSPARCVSALGQVWHFTVQWASLFYKPHDSNEDTISFPVCLPLLKWIWVFWQKVTMCNRVGSCSAFCWWADDRCTLWFY